MKIIKRPHYLQMLRQVKNVPDIKIISGLRRSGKSQLLLMFMAELRQEEPKANLVYIDFNDLRFEYLREYHKLHAYILEQYQDGAVNYLFIDEVQECPKFELVINSLHSQGKFDIYLTGSNAFLLSSDLATYFTGRFFEIQMYPFSFEEFSAYYDEESDVDKLFDRYIYEGGMPGTYLYQEESQRTAYIQNVYGTVTEKDLVYRYQIKNYELMRRLMQFMLDNIGNLTNASNIAAYLSAHGEKNNHVTVNNYLQYFCNAFLFYKLPRYDLRGKKYLASGVKYYLTDTAFRWAILGRRNADYGRLYENTVAIELLRRGYKVYVGMMYQKEIDFVAQKGSEQIYFQVADDISRQETLLREIDSLLKIRDAYPKVLLARTKHPAYYIEGIKVIDIARWLAKQED